MVNPGAGATEAGVAATTGLEDDVGAAIGLRDSDGAGVAPDTADIGAAESAHARLQLKSFMYTQSNRSKYTLRQAWQDWQASKAPLILELITSHESLDSGSDEEMQLSQSIAVALSNVAKQEDTAASEHDVPMDGLSPFSPK